MNNNGDVFRNRHPNLVAHTRSEDYKGKKDKITITRRSRIDLLVIDKDMIKDIQAATIIQDTCLHSDHDLFIFDMKDKWPHIQPSLQ